MRSTALLLTLMLASGATPAAALPQPDTSSVSQANGAPQVDPDALPVDLDRIRRELARQPLIVLDAEDVTSRSGMPTFRVRVEAEEPTIYDILGPNYLRGPVRAGAMTHQEFLTMVTPDYARGYAAFTNGQAATVAITSFAMQWALRTALERFQEAKDERARAAARREVAEALEALRKARLEAGLEDWK